MKTKKRTEAAIPVGTLVRFTADNLGASKIDELSRVTGDRYGVGDSGVVAFAHPNPALAARWFYVQVKAKTPPTPEGDGDEFLYVGVTDRMCEAVK